MTVPERTSTLTAFLASSAQALQTGWWWTVLGAVLCSALGAWFALKLARVAGVRSRHHVAVGRALRAKHGEDVGEDLLLDAGFEILARQPTLVANWQVDGALEEYTLRADWIVTRGGMRYVADAKTGDWARDVRTRATRRQLLEYVVQYQADGALLVDAEAGRIVTLHFEGLGSLAPEAGTGGGGRAPWVGAVMFAVALALVAWRLLAAFAP